MSDRPWMAPTLCALLSMFSLQAAAQAPTPMDFARHDAVNEVTLAPDGNHVALAVGSEDGLETRLEIVALDGSSKTQVLRFGPQEHVADVAWSADDQLIVSRARVEPLRPRPYSTGQLFTSDINGKHQDTLFGYIRESSKVSARRKDEGFARVDKILDDEPGVAMVVFRCWSCGEDPDTVVYRLDSRSGNRREIERHKGDADFFYDRAGVPRIRVSYDANDNPVLAWRTAASAAWTPVPKPIAGRSIASAHFDAKGDTLYASISDHGEPAGLYKIDMPAATRAKVAGLDDLEMMYYELAGRGGVPFAVMYTTTKPQVEYVDPTSEWATLHAGLMKSFPGQLVDFRGFSRDDNKVLFFVFSDHHPGAYYVYDRKAKHAQLIAESMPWIKPGQMAASRGITFKARDGKTLYGFYTASGTGRKPMVVVSHGGPHGISDAWGFDRDAQFLASRGYGVLQVNFRGSGGRGETFLREGYREWGGKIQDDIADGVHWAIDQQLADGNRICTFGASFGGYAALMQPIRFPEFYRCAVGYVGVYDLTVMYDEGDIKQTRSGRRYLERVIGSDPTTLIANSPARNVDRIKIPVFLAQGNVDRRVPMAQFTALKEAFPAGVPVETMIAKGEGHGFYDPKNAAELYTRAGVFLDRYIGNAAKAGMTPVTPTDTSQVAR